MWLRSHPRACRKLGFEELECRRVLAAVSVDTIADTLDGNVTNIAALLTNKGPDDRISLREAIEAANATGGPDLITFDPSVFPVDGILQTIALTEGQLFITDALTILGPGRDELTIDAGLGTDNLPGNGDGFRVFDIALAATSSEVVKISGLTITGGDVTGDGGGKRSSSSLELQSMAILDSVVVE